MPKFYLHIMDGIETEMDMDFSSDHEAVNSAFNALSLFATKSFPPPDNVIIEVKDAERARVATLKMTFSVDYPQRRQPIH